MDYQVLIEEITRLVMRELEKVSMFSQSPAGSGALKVLILIDPEMTDFNALFDSLRPVVGAASYRIVIPDFLTDSLKNSAGQQNFTTIVNPGRSEYGRIAGASGRVIVPFLSLTNLAKMANLIGDEPVPGIAVQALLQGVPVTVCKDHIYSLNFTDSAPSKKLLSLIRANLSVIEEMGVHITQLKGLPEALDMKENKPAILSTGVKNVVTNEDVHVAASQGVKILNFPRGTIITPLARDTAKTLGIEINIV